MSASPANSGSIASISLTARSEGGATRKASLDASAKLHRNVGGGERAEAMGDEDDGPLGLSYSGRDGAAPIGKLRAIPVLLRDATRGRELGLPAALPMVGAGAAEAGNDEDVGIARAHVVSGAGPRRREFLRQCRNESFEKALLEGFEARRVRGMVGVVSGEPGLDLAQMPDFLAKKLVELRRKR